MKVGILSYSKEFYSTKRLFEEAALLRSEVILINPYDQKIREVDFIIPLIGMTCFEEGISSLKKYEDQGVRVLNNSKAIMLASDKKRSCAYLETKGMSVPKSLSKEDIISFPIVMKPRRSSKGIGVKLAHSWDEINDAMILQEYISEAKGEDIRVLVLGNKVVGSMKRTGKKGDFRSNISCGGKGSKIELSSELTKIALNAARALNLNYAGVDIIYSKKGHKVLEVNSSPGLKEIEKVLEKNIAREIIKYSTSST